MKIRLIHFTIWQWLAEEELGHKSPKCPKVLLHLKNTDAGFDSFLKRSKYKSNKTLTEIQKNKKKVTSFSCTAHDGFSSTDDVQSPEIYEEMQPRGLGAAVFINFWAKTVESWQIFVVSQSEISKMATETPPINNLELFALD